MKLKSISSDTTEIGITGPKSILDSISEIGTENIDISQIKDNTSMEVKLKIPDGILIHNGQNNINVNILVEKKKTKEFTINYSIIGQQEGISIVPDKNNITIEVIGFEDDINNLTEANFSAQLDVSQYTKEGEYTKAPTVSLVGVNNVIINKVEEIKLIVSKDNATNGDVLEEPTPQQ